MSLSITDLKKARDRADDAFEARDYVRAAEAYQISGTPLQDAARFYFRFAFSLAALSRHAEAVQLYMKAIEAGSGALCYNNVGSSLQALKRNEEAAEAFQEAVRLSPGEALYWENLAIARASVHDIYGQLAALSGLAGCRDLTANEHLSVSQLREKCGDNERALDALRLAASLQPDDRRIMANVLRMLEKTGRAMEAYRLLRKQSQDSDNQKKLRELAAHLKAAERMLSRYQGGKPGKFGAAPVEKLRELGPGDYLSPYSLLDFPTGAEASPSRQEALAPGFGKPSNWSEIAGPAGRRRRLLRAEMELNGGRISWLPGILITEDQVHRILLDLDDDSWHPYHWALFRQPLLSRFLSHGEPEVFCSADGPTFPSGRADGSAKTFVDFVSPYFRSKWSALLRNCLDRGDCETAAMLLDSTLLLSPDDFDRGLDPLRRYIDRRAGEVRNLAAAVAQGSTTGVEKALSAAEFEARLLNRLPSHLGEGLCDDLALSYRKVGIDLVNVGHDVEKGERALTIAGTFRISLPSLQLLEKDRSALRGIQSDTARRKALGTTITVHRWFTKKELSITPEKVSWDGVTLLAGEIRGIRHSITRVMRYGTQVGLNTFLAVQGKPGMMISTTALNELEFNQAVQSLHNLYARQIVSQIRRVMGSHVVRMGPLELSENGISFRMGILFRKRHVLPWSDVDASAFSGRMMVRSKADNRIQTSCSLAYEWNAVVLPALVAVINNSSP